MDDSKRFQRDVRRLFGERIRADKAMACAMWQAMANAHWRRAGGETIRYDFRTAAKIIAKIHGPSLNGYADWYLCDQSGVVREDIGEAMAAAGWRYRVV